MAQPTRHRIQKARDYAAARLKDYPFYPAAQGEFHFLAGRPAEAGKHFERAMKLARSQAETNFFERKLEACRLA